MSEVHGVSGSLGVAAFVLLYCDYALTCREAGVEPLSVDALQRLTAALTETPPLTTIH